MSAHPFDAADLRRENEYLRQRVAQLQVNVTDLTAETTRLRLALDGLNGRGALGGPSSLRGGR
jgi:hypothetical protein